MLSSLVLILSTSYIVWYLEQFELTAVYPFDTTYMSPAEAGAGTLTETKFKTSDGVELVVWRGAPRDGHPTILYFQGNAGALKDRATRLAELNLRGYGIVAPAYRGSSGSTGAPEEDLLVADALSVSSSVSGPIILYGESLGAAVAIRLAAKGIGDALVLEAPFTSLVDLVAAQYPTEDLEDTITQRWESLPAVARVKQPLLVIHGEADRLVPHDMGRSIFAAAGSAEKVFLSVPAEGHTGLWTEDVKARLFAFLAREAPN